MLVSFPYGSKRIEWNAPDRAKILESRIGELKSSRPGLEIVREAMENPIDSPRLKELAKGKKDCTIIISDHTRPVPSRDILPLMLAELREGNPDIDVTLLVATGFHRLTSSEEIEKKVGPEIAKSEKIVVHDCSKNNVQIGVLPSGAPLVIDKVAAEADLLVSEGFIEPHFFAGFSGGRKSVLPGVCDRATVLGNHCSKFIDSEFSRTGKLDGNPINIDMIAAAKMARLAFIVNVIIDDSKKTVAAYAGDYVSAHRKGCDFLKSFCSVTADKADVCITTNGGAPLDQNIYQCVKGMTAAEAATREGGVIITCIECADGTGGDSFYRSLKDCESVEQLYAQFMATPQLETIPDQWESQILARILKSRKLIAVSRPELKQTFLDMKMDYAETLEEAWEKAKAIAGEDCSVNLIPDGISVIVE